MATAHLRRPIPASRSFKIATICSSLNLPRFTFVRLFRGGLLRTRGHISGAHFSIDAQQVVGPALQKLVTYQLFVKNFVALL